MSRRALFLDWDGTLVLTRDSRTVLDADGRPVILPLFLDRAAVWGLDLARSAYVVDSPKDRDAARAAGIGTFRWASEFFGWADKA